MNAQSLRIFHWMLAGGVATLFALGIWMVDLEYFHPWYFRAPELHMTVGLLILVVSIAYWGMQYARTSSIRKHAIKPWEQRLAVLVQTALMATLILTGLVGCLQVMASGSPLKIVGGLEIPPVIGGIADWKETLLSMHRLLAYTVILLSCLHILGVVKHMVFDKWRFQRASRNLGSY